MIKRLAISIFMTFIFVLNLFGGIALGADYDKTFYIAPIYEVAKNNYLIDRQNLEDMRSRLGSGGEYAKSGFTAVTRYMNETNGRASDFIYDPTIVRNIIQLSIDTNIPVMIILNGGPWGDVAVPENTEVNLIDYLEQDINNVQWKDDNTVPGDSDYPVRGLGRLLTLSNYNTTVKNYRKRNFQAAISEIYSFSKNYPNLFLGVNTDPEVFMSPYYFSDYNPLTIREFRDFEKSKFGNNIAAFNRAMGGINLRSFDEIDPPRPSLGGAMGGNPLGEEWTNFRAFLVDNDVQQQVNWARELGLTANKIYTHQTVRSDNPTWSRYLLTSPLYTAAVDGGSLGITTLQDLCFNKNLFSEAKALSSNWGIFEYNPAKPDPNDKKVTITDYNTFMSALQFAYGYNVHIIAPYMWSQEGNELFYNIKNSVFETAIRDFLILKANSPIDTISPGEIFGRIINTSGTPIVGAVIRANNIVPSNGAGYFRVTGLQAGIYTVYYDAVGYIGQTQVLEVRAGITTNTPTVVLSSNNPSSSGSISRAKKKKVKIKKKKVKKKKKK
ncbi:MAG: carboxypeptidase regulatory-like domain-containing protein [Actinobacteria bacterium]|nr:carboxypeptidase regulatory-like domain-containing protein [Actinomycetota bacterium]